MSPRRSSTFLPNDADAADAADAETKANERRARQNDASACYVAPNPDNELNAQDHPMTMYGLPLQRRLVGFVFPLIIVVIAVPATSTFVAAGLAWWPLFIFGLPGVLAVLICVEYWNVAIGFDDDQVHYHSVGYQVRAPWHLVSEQGSDSRVCLYVKQCEPHYSWWLGGMQAVLAVFMPARSRYAHGLMAIIPLYWFATGPEDTVMTEFRRLALGRIASQTG